MGYPMCDFVDAGDGKECADSKLKGNVKVHDIYSSRRRRRQYLTLTLACFTHDMADVQCKAVIFGGSADNGYARLLQPYVGDNSKSNQIILIEGPPFARELAVLQEKFLVARYPDVFRNSKLPPRRVSFSTTPPPTPIPNALSYAATITNSVNATVVRTDDAYDPSVMVPAQNSRGQRLDAIISPPQSLVNIMRTTKHCNMFHILGECTYTSCNYLHGTRLDKKGIEARRLILRQAPCVSRLQCKDEKCLLGHQCPDKGCTKSGRGCRFTREMHNVDRS